MTGRVVRHVADGNHSGEALAAEDTLSPSAQSTLLLFV